MTHKEAIKIIGELLLSQHFAPWRPEAKALQKALQALNRELLLGITE